MHAQQKLSCLLYCIRNAYLPQCAYVTGNSLAVCMPHTLLCHLQLPTPVVLNPNVAIAPACEPSRFAQAACRLSNHACLKPAPTWQGKQLVICCKPQSSCLTAQTRLPMFQVVPAQQHQQLVFTSQAACMHKSTNMQ